MVCVKGMLVGGANDLRELTDNGKLKKMLAVWAAYAAEHYKLDSWPRDILLG